MHKVPEISISHPGVVVDAMEFRAPWFGFFGRPSWEVRWRLLEDPQQSGTSVLPLGAEGGSAELAGESFNYVARWHDTEKSGEPDRAVVTPGTVLRLAEFARRR